MSKENFYITCWVVIGIAVGGFCAGLIETNKFKKKIAEITKEVEKVEVVDEFPYACDSRKTLKHCQKGDLVLVSPGTAPVVCDISLLRGGLMVRDHVLPLFDGGARTDHILCVYRGSSREIRTP